MKSMKRLTYPLIILILAAAGVLAWQLGLFDTFLTAQVTLNWTTENTIDTAGFNLYRAADPEAEPVKVNDDLIAPGSDPFVSSEHEYIDDRDVVRGQTYYYWLETVDRLGNTSREGPFAIEAR